MMTTRLFEEFLKGNQHIYTDSEMYYGDGINLKNKSLCRKLKPDEIETMRLYFKMYPLYQQYDFVYKYKPIDGIYFNCVYTSNNGLFKYKPIDVINNDNGVFVAIHFLSSVKLFNCIVPLEDFLYGNVYCPYTPLFLNKYYIGNVPIVNHEFDLCCWLESICNCYYDNDYVNLIPRFDSFDAFIDFNNNLISMGKSKIYDSSDKELYITKPSYEYKIYGSQKDYSSILYITHSAYDWGYERQHILLYKLIDK